MTRIRRRTTCSVPGHGTWCDPSRERDNLHSRGTEERLALLYELEAGALKASWRGRPSAGCS